MLSEVRKQSMAWIEMDYSKHTYFRWKVKCRLEYLGALGMMGETAPLLYLQFTHMIFIIYMYTLHVLIYLATTGTDTLTL